MALFLGQLPANVLGKAAEYSQSALAPSTHVKTQLEFQGFCVPVISVYVLVYFLEWDYSS